MMLKQYGRAARGLTFVYWLHLRKDPAPVAVYFIIPLVASPLFAELYAGESSGPRSGAAASLSMTFGLLLMTNSAYALHRDDVVGVYDRVVGPWMTARSYQLGRVIGPLLLVSLQLVVLQVIWMEGKYRTVPNLGRIVAIALCWGLLVASLGQLLYRRSRTFAQFNALATVVSLVLCSVGGVLVPTSQLPSIVRPFSRVLPLSRFRSALLDPQSISANDWLYFVAIATFTLCLGLVLATIDTKSSTMEVIG